HNGSDLFAPEKPGKSVAARPCKFIDHHDFGAEDPLWRPRNILRISRRDKCQKLPFELLREKIRNVTATVIPLVDDDAVFIELRVERLIKLDDSIDSGIRHVHVADSPTGGIRDFLAIRLHPLKITRPVFISCWLDDNLPRAVGARFAVELQCDLL